MAAHLGPILINQTQALLQSGFKTSEGRLVMLFVAACGYGAYLEVSDQPISWYWPISAALVIVAYCLARGSVKRAAAEIVAEAESEATAPTLAATRSRQASPLQPPIPERPMSSAGFRPTLPAALLLGVFLALSACAPVGPGATAPTPMQDPRAVLAQSCETYARTLEALAEMHTQDQLSRADVQSVEIVRRQIGPICEDPPANPEPFIHAVSSALSQLVAIQLTRGER